ncbi:MAG: ABC transporter permease [Micropruina sp.]|uniref:ABC transporter permease n=1 Tax=Micropruina sp. TaxID=2737536 RepID=UPI0039E5A34D
MRSTLARVVGRVWLCILATSLVYLLAGLSFDPLAELRQVHPPVPPEVLAARAEQLGLGLPLAMRLLHWWQVVATGDLGITVDGQPVSDELGRRLGTTLRLFLPGGILAVTLGVGLGVWSAARNRSVGDAALTGFSLLLLALPVFVLGTVLKILWLPVNLAAGVQLLPFSGESTPGVALTGWPAVLDQARHLVLPTLAIMLPQLAFYSRYQRAAMLDVLDSEFLRTARAKGHTRWGAIGRHGVRMALIPMTALIAFSFGLHLAGGVFTERIFGWHGLGDWLLLGISAQDANVVAASALLLSAMVAVAGVAADLLLAGLDPRTRRLR